MEDHPTPRRPLRVAHLMQYFAIGGLERVVERLSVACASRGVESLVIAYLGDGPIRTALEERGVRTLCLEGGPGWNPRLCLRLRSVLVRERIDVLHTHHLGPFIYGAPAARLSGRRHVHTEHSHELYDTTRRRLVGAMMSPLAELVAVTPEVSEYRKRFPGRCRVIPNGVPLPPDDPKRRARARAQLGVAGDAFVIGCVARLAPEKNHGGLLEAFGRLRREEARAVLVCAGGGPLESRLRDHARRAGLDPYVSWLGSIDDMSALYPALDVCALNSDREGMPLSLLEAMSYGVPVVATDVGGVGELLAPDAGLVVPPRSPGLMARALGSLARAPEMARSLGDRGKTRVRERHSVEHMAEQYVALYREMTTRHVPPSNMESARCA